MLIAAKYKTRKHIKMLITVLPLRERRSLGGGGGGGGGTPPCPYNRTTK